MCSLFRDPDMGIVEATIPGGRTSVAEGIQQ